MTVHSIQAMAWLVLAAFNKAYSENSRWKNRTRKGVMNSIEVVGRADEEAVIVKDLSAIKENLCTLDCTDRNGALNKDPRVNCANSSKKRVPKDSPAVTLFKSGDMLHIQPGKHTEATVPVVGSRGTDMHRADHKPWWYPHGAGFVGLKDSRARKSGSLALRFQKAAEARQQVWGHDSRISGREAVEMECKL